MILTGLLLGAVLGFVLQRGRFCVTGAFRDVWVSRQTKWLTAFGVAIAVQSVGVFTLDAFGVIHLAAVPALPWLAVAGGSLLFGVSIVLAGGCATGTYYRAGEGLVGSWLALVMYAVSAAAMKYGPLSGLDRAVRGVTAPLTTVHGSLGVGPWPLVALLVAGVGAAVWRHLRRPALPVATLPPRRRGVAHLLLERRWHPFATAVVIGLIAVAAYPLSYATGRRSGLGVTTPSADLASFLTTGEPARLNWGTLLIVGIVAGSFVAAKASGEFRLRLPDGRQALYSVIGGAGMGVGAAWAGGCTIGNSLVNTALFSYQGWLALGFTLLGVGLAVRLVIRPHRREGALSSPAAGELVPA